MTNDNKKPCIALTFDDGPSEHTERILDTFKRYGGHGTFFVVGNALEWGKDILYRTAAEGHEVGNHTLSHAPLSYMTEEDIIKDISTVSDRIKDITGKTPRFVRPPYGDINESVKCIGMRMGYAFAGWSLDSRDWESLCAESVLEAIMSSIKENDIVLCHDSHPSTAEAIEMAIPALMEKGYELVTLSELLERKGIPMENGKYYQYINE